MNKITQIPSSLVLLLIALAASAEAPPSYRLLWKDTFDGDRIDASKWTAVVGPRKGGQSVADAVRVKDGVLTITTYTKDGKHCTGFLTTKGKFETTYGYFEAAIRFNTTPGQWGAFWVTSPTIGKPLGDPAKAGTEIDIVEHRASDSNGKDISGSYVINLHWDGYDKGHKTEGAKITPPFSAMPLPGEWHTYALHWTPERYTFYYDGKEQWTTTNAVSRRSEFILLTCEITATNWAGRCPAEGYGSLADSKTKMEVDWVRVWQAPSKP
ncbi:MAG: glycoside hydrolase family 16 protein [Verrucomicrobia bacterium]|nr:glycoside hydrolase family 16 protein [Verrucomicrobiota bacterium]